MGFLVTYKIGGKTHTLGIGGSDRVSDFDLQWVVALNVCARSSPAEAKRLDLTLDQLLRERLTHAGVSDTEISQ